MRYLAIPLVLRRDGNYYLRVVDSDGTYARVSWVGPFPDRDSIVDWIEQYALESVEADYLTPTDIGLPASLAELRPAAAQARAARLHVSRSFVHEDDEEPGKEVILT